MLTLNELIARIFQTNQTLSKHIEQENRAGTAHDSAVKVPFSDDLDSFCRQLEILNETLIDQLNEDSAALYRSLPLLKRLYGSLTSTRVTLRNDGRVPAMQSAVDAYGGHLSELSEIMNDTETIHLRFRTNVKLQSIFSRLAHDALNTVHPVMNPTRTMNEEAKNTGVRTTRKKLPKEGVTTLNAGKHPFDSIAWLRLSETVQAAGLKWTTIDGEDHLVLKSDWELVLRKKKR